MPDPEVEWLLTTDTPFRLYDVSFRIVGSGFARTDTVCLNCEREIAKGSEAWVTSYTDNSAIVLHPGCWNNAQVHKDYAEWLEAKTA